ncbi:MAG: hypothetical protein ACMXYE_04630 [Candidatus Woesearchaeota archaeon]
MELEKRLREIQRPETLAIVTRKIVENKKLPQEEAEVVVKLLAERVDTNYAGHIAEKLELDEVALDMYLRDEQRADLFTLHRVERLAAKQDHPILPEIRKQIVMHYENEQEFKQAAELAEEFEMHDRAVINYERVKFWQEAVNAAHKAKMYDRALLLCEKDNDLTIKAAVIATEAGYADRAVAYAEKEAALHGDYVFAENIARQNQRPEKADEFRATGLRKAGKPYTFIAKAEAAEKKGDHTKAQKMYEKANEMFDRAPDEHLTTERALVAEKLGMYEKAGALYEQAADFEKAHAMAQTMQDDKRAEQLRTICELVR